MVVGAARARAARARADKGVDGTDDRLQRRRDVQGIGDKKLGGTVAVAGALVVVGLLILAQQGGRPESVGLVNGAGHGKRIAPVIQLEVVWVDATVGDEPVAQLIDLLGSYMHVRSQLIGRQPGCARRCNLGHLLIQFGLVGSVKTNVVGDHAIGMGGGDGGGGSSSWCGSGGCPGHRGDYPELDQHRRRRGW